MINSNTDSLKKRLSFAVYGLIALLIVVLMSFFTLLQEQKESFIDLTHISNEYHAQNIDMSLELLKEIGLFKLWLRDNLLNVGGKAVFEYSEAELRNYLSTDLGIKTAEIKYWISQNTRKIISYHKEFKHPGFEELINNLQISSNDALNGLNVLEEFGGYSVLAYDKTLNSLQYVLEQLYQLHHQENYSVRESIYRLENHNKSQLFKVVLFLVTLTILGGYKILSYIRKLLQELTITQLNLLKSSRQLNNAQRLANIGSWELDYITGESALSQELTQIFELPEDSSYFSEDDFINIVHPDDKLKLQQIIDKSLSLKEPYSAEYRIFLNSNIYKNISETGEITYDINGDLKSCLRSFQDITERKKIDNELQDYRHKLEVLVSQRTEALKTAQEELINSERLATLGKLTATVSHELRNPLAAMRPSLYIIEKTSNKNDNTAIKAIERIDRNISRCDNIIDELLDYTKISKFDFEPTLLDHWLDTLLNEQNLPDGISIVKELGLNDAEITFDGERLRRAIINVVENACHSMLDDNKQILTDRVSQLHIKTQAVEQKIKIIISDTGCGMPEEVQNKVFEPLFSTKGFGVGLGMPTVKKIMQQHNGGIEIKSQQGIGTQVTLWFPKDRENILPPGIDS